MHLTALRAAGDRQDVSPRSSCSRPAFPVRSPSLLVWPEFRRLRRASSRAPFASSVLPVTDMEPQKAGEEIEREIGDSQKAPAKAGKG